MPLVGAESAEQAAGDAVVQRAVFGLHDAAEAVDAEDAPAAARCGGLRRDGQAGLIAVGLLADDGPLAGQLSLAADALVVRGVERLIFVGGEASREVAAARPGPAVLAKVGAKLFGFFGHVGRDGLVRR